MGKLQLKLGCDPEFFLKDTKTGAFVSAHDKVPGTKSEPYRLPGGGYVQADGTAVEFNIPPSGTVKDFVNNIHAALSDIRKEFFADKRFEFAFVPVAEYTKEYFDSLPLEAKALGCEPDFDAYNKGNVNPKPNANYTFRTGSGHIHIGYLSGDDLIKVEPSKDPKHMEDCCAVSIALDNTLLSFKTMWDKDKKRAQLYGAPGCFRPKSYGLEYRSLSNAWLNYPLLWPWLFNTTKGTILAMQDGSAKKLFAWNDGMGQDMRNIQNIQNNIYQCLNMPTISMSYINTGVLAMALDGSVRLPTNKLGRPYKV